MNCNHLGKRSMPSGAHRAGAVPRHRHSPHAAPVSGRFVLPGTRQGAMQAPQTCSSPVRHAGWGTGARTSESGRRQYAAGMGAAAGVHYAASGRLRAVCMPLHA